MLFLSKDPQSKVLNVTIIGAGPVGLACLVELLIRAHAHSDVSFEINVIEKRDLNFTRGQKIIMAKDESENKGISWIDFCKRSFFLEQKLQLTSQGDLLVDGVIPESQTLRYGLVRKLLRQQEASQNPVNVSIKQLQTALLEQIQDDLPKNVRINWNLASSVTQIDIETSTLTVSDEKGFKELFFHVLINCEGEKRETVSIINNAAIKAKKPIPFQYTELEPTETCHMAIKIKIREPLSGTYNTLIKELEHQYMLNRSKQKEVAQFVNSTVSINGHELAIKELPFLFDPNSYKQQFYTTGWTPKYFVAGLIPEEIHAIQDQNKKREILLKWASCLLAYNYNIDPDAFVIDTKIQTEKALQQRANTFTSKVKAVANPVMELPNNSVIALVGDSCMSPYYWEGISSTIGLNETLSLLDCIFVKDTPQGNPYQNLRVTYAKYKAFISECLSDNDIEHIEREAPGVVG